MANKNPKFKVVYRPLDSIKQLENNPRYIKKEDFERLCASVQNNPELFEAQPIILSNRTGENVIIAGNQRYKAALEVGLKEVPTILLEGLTEAKEREIIIRTNVQNGKWDWDILSSEAWGSVDELQDWGVDCSFLTDEAEQDLNSERKETEDDEYDENEHQIETKCKLGDIYQLGEHRLMCGDSTKPENVRELLAGKPIQLYLTDPPYNVAYGYDNSATEGHRKDGLVVLNDKMDNDSFEKFLTDAFNAANENMEKGASFYIFHSDTYSYWFRKALLNTVDLTLRENLIWNKDSMVLGRQDYQWKHEPCLYGWKEGGSHNWFSDRKQTTVLDFPRPKVSKEHPTMKPIPLFAYLIQNSSQEGWNVYDSFGGSGTTLMACEQLNRKAFLMELDPHYCDVIINRWETYAGKKAVKLNKD